MRTNFIKLGFVDSDNSGEEFPKLNRLMFLPKRPTLDASCCSLTANNLEEVGTLRDDRGVEVNLKALWAVVDMYLFGYFGIMLCEMFPKRPRYGFQLRSRYLPDLRE